MSVQYKSFSNRVALVTGAASGIGRASALAFAHEGARVVVADINREGGEDTVSSIRKAGGDASFVLTDVSVSSQVRRLIETTINEYGRLDFAHNNAGIAGVRAKILECAEDDWNRTLAVNLTGIWLCLKYEIPPMLKSGGGAIVNTSSVYGLLGAPRLAAYAATKHAIVGLTRSAALEHYRAGIRINAVCPGLIDTGMAEAAILGNPEAASDMDFSLSERLLWKGKKMVARGLIASQLPARRPGTPDEVAAAVLWLCSDGPSYVSGQTLPIDGGLAIS